MKKLDHKCLGPFSITEIVSKHAYRLALPLKYAKLHNVFHISLLEPYTPSAIPNRDVEPLTDPELEEGIFEVEAIVDCKSDKRTKNGITYLVRWKGYEHT